MKRVTPFLFFLFLFQFITFAGQEDELFQQANDAFQANNFDKAIELYEQIRNLDVESFELEYNLGNAYYRKNNIGKAILHYERALLQSPNDEDAKYNLKLAHEQVEDRDALPEFFLAAWWKKMRMATTSGAWGSIAMILWWIGCAGLILWLLGKTRDLKKLGFWIGVFGIVLSILPFALSWSRMSYEKNTRQAIVQKDKTPLKSAPDTIGSEILNLAEGEKIELLDQLSGFWQVRLANGEKGWVSQADVEEI